MMDDSKNIKFFMGFLLNGEIKMHLYHNSKWKEASLFQDQLLKEVKFNKKDYLGIYTDSPILYPDIKVKEKQLKDELKLHCPNLQIDRNEIYLFPQFFLS